MSLAERAGLALLHRIDPERAHALALAALRLGLVPLPRPFVSPRLAVRIAGLDLPNPLGLAAGFDKNAVALAQLLRAGFGFVEVGAITPRPQPGNPRPRLFRLPEARAVINRFGFNNDGAEAIARRLARPRPHGIVGINLGVQPRQRRPRGGLRRGAAHLRGRMPISPRSNVSSPNTAGLRGLQAPGELGRAARARGGRARRPCPGRSRCFSRSPPIWTRPRSRRSPTSPLPGASTGSSRPTPLSRATAWPAAGTADQAGGLSGPPLAPLARAALARAARPSGRAAAADRRGGGSIRPGKPSPASAPAPARCRSTPP
ncbi:MAG: hypothetical protein KatS3mg118_3053 [Paracoccaceae bacterium]|nr:MAG: hypothetical protein KatS3mg118_3053 [Paracoccaceae bacterium]